MADLRIQDLNPVPDNTLQDGDFILVKTIKRTGHNAEDCHITYKDFLAGINLSKFVAKSGGMMTGNLDLVNNIYVTGKGTDNVVRNLIGMDNTNTVRVGNAYTNTKLASSQVITVSYAGKDYKLYSEYNKPTAADVAALSVGGGTVAGDVNITGNLTVDKAVHFKAEYLDLKATDDFNNFGDTRTVSVTNAQLAKNAPNGASYGILESVGRGTALVVGNYITQRFTDKATGAVWTRSRTDTAATWTQWAKQYDSVNKPTGADLNFYTKQESDARHPQREGISYVGFVNGTVKTQPYMRSSVDNAVVMLVPQTTKINGHTLTGDFAITAHEVDAYTKAESDAGYTPKTRTVNGHALSGDVVVTAQDVFKTSVLLTVDLDTVTTPGIYHQPANAGATTAFHYPSANAGTLEVKLDAGTTQVYREYGAANANKPRVWHRGLYGSVWSPWAMQYDTLNKPQASDIGVDVSAVSRQVALAMYPVGSLYLSTSSANPNTLPFFAGTGWSPYAQGCALVGMGNANGVNAAIDKVIGAATHTISVAEMPSHVHAVGNHAHSTPDHTHTISASTAIAAGGAHGHGFSGSANSAGDHWHKIRSNFRTGNNQDHTSDGYFVGKMFGGNAPSAGMNHEQVMFFQEGNYPAETTVGSQRVRVENGGAHTHSLTGSVAAAAAHGHGATTTLSQTASGHGTTGAAGAQNTTAAGSGAAISLVQPSMGVYAWKRTS